MAKKNNYTLFNVPLWLNLIGFILIILLNFLIWPFVVLFLGIKFFIISIIIGIISGTGGFNLAKKLSKNPYPLYFTFLIVGFSILFGIYMGLPFLF